MLKEWASRRLADNRGSVSIQPVSRSRRHLAVRKALARLIALVTLVLLDIPKAPGAAATEYEMKAAFLFNVIRFIDWPPPDKGPSAGLIVGIVGSSSIEAPLRVLESTQVKGQPLRVTMVRRDATRCGCQVLFTGKFDLDQQAALLENAHATATLTVGETPQFVRSGGMVALITEGRRLVIEINLDLLRARGFKINSQLLEIARVVKPSPSKEGI